MTTSSDPAQGTDLRPLDPGPDTTLTSVVLDPDDPDLPWFRCRPAGRWNGWLIPAFTPETMCAVITWTNQLAELDAENPRLAFDGDDVVVIDPGTADGPPRRFCA